MQKNNPINTFSLLMTLFVSFFASILKLVGCVSSSSHSDNSAPDHHEIKNIHGAYSIIAANTVKPYQNIPVAHYPAPYFWMNYFNAVCGDADGDGQSETPIAFTDDTGF